MTNKKYCCECQEEVTSCEYCSKSLEVGDEIICNSFNHYCSKECLFTSGTCEEAEVVNEENRYD